MSKTLKLAVGSMMLVFMMSVASCTHDAPFAGTWKAATPANVTSDFPGCRNAMSEMTVSFAQDQNNTDGTVVFNDELSIIRPLSLSDKEGAEAVYLNIKGNGTVKGKWSRDVDDADDLLVDLDYSTLSVNIDPGSMSISGADGVSISSEKRDSIAKAVKTEMDIYLRSKLSRFNVLSDIEIDKDGKYLDFEIHSPETDCRFVNVDK